MLRAMFVPREDFLFFPRPRLPEGRPCLTTCVLLLWKTLPHVVYPGGPGWAKLCKPAARWTAPQLSHGEGARWEVLAALCPSPPSPLCGPLGWSPGTQRYPGGGLTRLAVLLSAAGVGRLR